MNYGYVSAFEKMPKNNTDGLSLIIKTEESIYDADTKARVSYRQDYICDSFGYGDGFWDIDFTVPEPLYGDYAFFWDVFDDISKAFKTEKTNHVAITKINKTLSKEYICICEAEVMYWFKEPDFPNFFNQYLQEKDKEDF